MCLSPPFGQGLLRGWQELNRPASENESVNIPVLGQVSAGNSDEFELNLHSEYPNDDTLSNVPIPNIEYRANFVALEVVGNSMESEGIVSGDYIIVELIQDTIGSWIENRMLVAYYLTQRDEEMLDTELVEPSSLNLTGPTLKIFKGSYLDRNNRVYYRLGRVKDNDETNPYEIETRILRPIGLVIGVYRPFENLLD